MGVWSPPVRRNASDALLRPPHLSPAELASVALPGLVAAPGGHVDHVRGPRSGTRGTDGTENDREEVEEMKTELEARNCGFLSSFGTGVALAPLNALDSESGCNWSLGGGCSWIDRVRGEQVRAMGAMDGDFTKSRPPRKRFLVVMFGAFIKDHYISK